MTTRCLGRNGSKDDLSLELDARPAKRSAFRYADPNVARSAPPATRISASTSATPAQPSPSAGRGRAAADVGVRVTDVKGKGKEVERDDERSNFMRRFAGPSTGKAGLKRDPKEVEKIIYEASKGSKYFQNEQKKAADTEAQVKRVVARLQAKVAERKGNVSAEQAQAEKLAADLELTRVLDQTIVVVDADAFYAVSGATSISESRLIAGAQSVEELDDPSLKGKAFGVGGGVLTTASYEARKYGVRSAMAGFVATKLCPQLIFVKPNFKRYSECSYKIMDILRRYDPNMAPASLDEAYMNITAHLQKSGQTPAEAVEEMRAAVKAETGLTVSAGVAANKTLAKIAADINKPDGQCVIPPTREDAMAFMRHMPIRKVPGVGRVTEHWLTAVDIKTVGDVWDHRANLLLASGSDGTGTLTFLLNAYLGLGGTKVEPGKREDRKSVGREDTFGTEHRLEKHIEKLREIADTLGEDLERLDYSGRTLTLKIKLDTYEPLTRAHTISSTTYLSKADDLFRIGKALLEREVADRHATFDSGKRPRGSNGCRDLKLRLLGLRVTNLRDERKAAEARAAKGSIDEWTKQPATTANPARKEAEPTFASTSALPIDLDDGDMQWEVENADGTTHRLATPPPQPSVNDTPANDVEGATCPMCNRKWTRVSQAMLEAHVDDCLTRAAAQATATAKVKPKTTGTAKIASKPSKPDAFAQLMSGSTAATKRKR